MPRYSIELHAWDFQLTDQRDRVVFGGVRACRVVEAATPDVAERLAILAFRQELREERDVLSDVGNIPIAVEDIGVLDDDEEWSGTALVFYIDTEDPGNRDPDA